MCKYHKECDFDFQYELATESMNILADALRKTEPNNSEIPNNCEDKPQTEYERTSEQREHDILYEPTYDLGDGSM